MTGKPRIIREPLAGCRRTAILLGMILLGVIFVIVGLQITKESEVSRTTLRPAASLPPITVFSQCCNCGGALAPITPWLFRKTQPNAVWRY